MEISQRDIDEAKRLYDHLFHREINSLSTFSEGTSNIVFLVNDETVIRLKRSDDPNFYSAFDERQAFIDSSSRGLAPNLIYFNLENASTAYDLAKGTHYVGPSLDERSFYKLGMAIKLLHDLPAVERDFNAATRFDVYKQISHVRLVNSEEAKIRKIVEPWLANERKVFSHNDLVKGNIIRESPTSPIKFLDFEFAGPNNEMWDLASVLSENGIEERGKQEALLKGYFNLRYKTDLYHKCHYIMLYQDYLWYYWAIGKYRATGEGIYKTIADGKFVSLTDTHRFGKF